MPYDPATKNFARGQLEIMGLMNRRAQAVLEIPSRLGQCRTPQDLVNEQLRYWRTAYEQYSETAGRMMELMLPLGTSPFGFGTVADQTTEDEHDYITFPEPQERAPARRVSFDRTARRRSLRSAAIRRRGTSCGGGSSGWRTGALCTTGRPTRSGRSIGSRALA